MRGQTKLTFLYSSFSFLFCFPYCWLSPRNEESAYAKYKPNVRVQTLFYIKMAFGAVLLVIQTATCNWQLSLALRGENEGGKL